MSITGHFPVQQKQHSLAAYHVCCSTEMATRVKIILLTCLLLLVALMEETKPVWAKQGDRLKQRIQILEKSMKELNKTITKLEECNGR